MHLFLPSCAKAEVVSPQSLLCTKWAVELPAVVDRVFSPHPHVKVSSSPNLLAADNTSRDSFWPLTNAFSTFSYQMTEGCHLSGWTNAGNSITSWLFGVVITIIIIALPFGALPKRDLPLQLSTFVTFSLVWAWSFIKTKGGNKKGVDASLFLFVCEFLF